MSDEHLRLTARAKRLLDKAKSAKHIADRIDSRKTSEAIRLLAECVISIVTNSEDFFEVADDVAPEPEGPTDRGGA